MIDIKNIEGVYFVGIGGIGMSALALYFLKDGIPVAGYDRTETLLTRSLSDKGCKIVYDDDPDMIPVLFRDPGSRERIPVIFTPAVPKENRILSWFRERNYMLFKRSEILGEISAHTYTLAVAGAHGKTTISTMTAHLLKQSHVDCSAFLGGISKNYGSNLLLGDSKFTVMEADEFDRSFHRLHPVMAVITSVDEDHLDIYGDHATLIEAYNIFCTRIKHGGALFINKSIQDKIRVPEGISCFTYSATEDADFTALNIKHCHDYYSFDLRIPGKVITDIHFPFPGIINIENLTVAIAMALRCGVTEPEIRKAALVFQGVRRRFDIRVNLPGLVYIDDYAHHPGEIRAFITSVREYFGNRKITGIFQPHLFSRTRDHARGFAAILDELDTVMLLPVYPAREEPIPGVSSEMILNLMKLRDKKLVGMEEIPEKLDVSRLDVLVTIGAGDIDKLAGPIEKKLMDYRR
jgi:UDP-N-acetylmuramate--alanine ligase